ncbi:hypothetical protein FRC05_002354 [Tulasnella sp. 425]|nr:hypothetical protein FRC05_002354 [Tulasnella sp. 425]
MISLARTFNSRTPFMALRAVRQFSTPTSVEIRSKLKDDLKTAMKTKDALKAKVIRAVMAEVLNAEKANPDRFNDSMIMPIIQKAVTQRNDSATQYKTAGREDLAVTEIQERDILEVYLPTQLTEAEVDEKLKVALESLGDKANIGSIMKEFYTKVEKASVKGDLVSARAKALLASRS